MLTFCCHLGGYDGQNTTLLKTTEFIHLNGSKTEDPIELPESRSQHCMVEYAGIIILMGGRYVTHYGHFFVQYLNPSAFQTYRNSFRINLDFRCSVGGNIPTRKDHKGYPNRHVIRFIFEGKSYLPGVIRGYIYSGV